MTAEMIIEESDKVSDSQLKEFLRQVEEGEIKGYHLQAMLEGRNPFMPFKLLGRYKIGTYKNVEALEYAIEKAGIEITDWAKAIMGKPLFKVSDTEEEIILVEITIPDLGHKDGGRYPAICERVIGTEVKFEGQKYTVEFCPYEAAPQFCLKYFFLKDGEWFRITIPDSEDHGKFFVVGCGRNQKVLSGGNGQAVFYDGNSSFVFWLRKKS